MPPWYFCKTRCLLVCTAALLVTACLNRITLVFGLFMQNAQRVYRFKRKIISHHPLVLSKLTHGNKHLSYAANKLPAGSQTPHSHDNPSVFGHYVWYKIYLKKCTFIYVFYSFKLTMRKSLMLCTETLP